MSPRLKFTHGGKRLAVQFGTDEFSIPGSSTRPRSARSGSMPFVNRHQFALSADGALVATSDLAGNSGSSPEVQDDLPKLELTDANLFDFRPDSKATATGDAKGNVTVHLVTGGKPTFTVKQEGAILGLVYSPNGTRLAVGSHSADGTDLVRVYEPGKEKPVAEIAGMNQPRSWIGSDALAVGNGAEAGVYDIAKKEWLGRVKGVVGEFAVSPDGTKLAATGTGLRVRCTGAPAHLASSCDGAKAARQRAGVPRRRPDRRLLVGSADGRALFLLTTDTAYLWPVGAAGKAQVAWHPAGARGRGDRDRRPVDRRHAGRGRPVRALRPVQTAAGEADAHVQGQLRGESRGRFREGHARRVGHQGR